MYYPTAPNQPQQMAVNASLQQQIPLSVRNYGNAGPSGIQQPQTQNQNVFGAMAPGHMPQMMSFQTQRQIPGQMGGALMQSTQINQTPVNTNRPLMSINFGSARAAGLSSNTGIHLLSSYSQQQPPMMSMGVGAQGIAQNAQIQPQPLNQYPNMSVGNVQANVMETPQQHSQPAQQQQPSMQGRMIGPRMQPVQQTGQMPASIVQGNAPPAMNPQPAMQSIQTTMIANRHTFSINVGNARNAVNVTTSGGSNNFGIQPLNAPKQQQTVNIGVQGLGQNAQNIHNQLQQLMTMLKNQNSTNAVSTIMNQRQPLNQNPNTSAGNVQANVMATPQQHSQPAQQQQPSMQGQMIGPRMQPVQQTGQMLAGIVQGNAPPSMNPQPAMQSIRTTMNANRPTFSINVGNARTAVNVATSGVSNNFGIQPLNAPTQQQTVNIGVQGLGQNVQNIRNQLQQLMTMLKNQNSTSPTLQQQLLNMLRSHPQLISTYLKYRQAQRQNQNAQRNLLQATTLQQQASTGNTQSNIGITANAPNTTAQSDVDDDSDDESPISPIQNSSATKEWHDSIKADYRKHVINELLQTILPSPNHRKRTHKEFIFYAKEIERDIYERANSENEYHRLIADNIYKMHEEMKEEPQQAQ